MSFLQLLLCFLDIVCVLLLDSGNVQANMTLPATGQYNLVAIELVGDRWTRYVCA